MQVATGSFWRWLWERAGHSFNLGLAEYTHVVLGHHVYLLPAQCTGVGIASRIVLKALGQLLGMVRQLQDRGSTGIEYFLGTQHSICG